MELRKGWILIGVIVWHSVMVSTAIADGTTGGGAGGTIADAIERLITYLSSVIVIKNQADAEMIFMNPPGTNEAAQNAGMAAG